MRLTDYIAQVGAKAFSIQFGVTIRTTYSYRQGVRKPRGALAARIVAETPVTMDGIYGPDPTDTRSSNAVAA